MPGRQRPGVTAAAGLLPDLSAEPPGGGEIGEGRQLVLAILVLCDGTEWLAASLDALAGQTRPPDRVLAVDAGSVDGGATICDAAFRRAAEAGGPPGSVLQLPRGTGFAAAVNAGLAHLGVLDPGSFVWLLHDDCAPTPDALDRLLAYASLDPSAAVVGPKIRDWYAPNMVCEVGVTVDGAGRRRTGMPPGGEHDDGRHDSVRDVLAVSTAGALVRYAALTAVGGLDPALRAGTDVDLGWRIGLAGMRVAVVPAAVVRHARAGPRRQAPAGRGRRRAALYTTLVNTRAIWMPLAVLRLLVCVATRTMSLLVRGRARAAWDEVTATLAVLAAPRVLLRGRRLRAGTRLVPPRALRPLFARRFAMRPAARLPAHVPSHRLPSPRPPADALPSGAQPSDALAADRTVTAEIRPGPVRRPWIALLLALGAVGIVAGRSLIGPGTLTGGRLLPVPGGIGDLWHALVSGWQGGTSAGFGGPGAAPSWTAPFAFLATVTGARPWLAVDVLLLGGPALAGLAAWVATARLRLALLTRLLVAAGYGLVPLLSGAASGGRFDTVAAMIVVPLALAAGADAVAPPGPRRAWWRGGWIAALRLGVALGVAIAWSPPLAPLAAVVLLGAPVVARRPAALVRCLLAADVAVAVVGWSASDLVARPRLFLTGYGAEGGVRFGWPHPYGSAPLGLATCAVAGLVGIVGLAGLLRSDGRTIAFAGWFVALCGAGGAAAATRGIADVRGWPGPAFALAAAGILLAAAGGARGARARLRLLSFSWRQPAAVAALAGLSAAPVVLGSLIVMAGVHTPVGRVAGSSSQLAGTAGGRMLVVKAGAAVAGGPRAIRYSLVGPNGPRLADLDAPVPAAATAFTDAVVADLASGRAGGAAAWLPLLGVRGIAVPAGSAGYSALTDAFDRSPGLVRDQAAAGTTVWRVAGAAPVDGPGRAGASAPVRVLDGGAAIALAACPTATACVAAPPVSAGVPVLSGRIMPGLPGRIAVLAEPADPGWSATLDGRVVPSRTVWGSLQAFDVPAEGGALAIRYADRIPRRAVALQAGVVCLVTLMVMAAAVRGRRRDAA